MERDIVLIGGIPASGKTRMGASLTEQLNTPDFHVSHISIGNVIRAIGRHALHSHFTTNITDHLNTYGDTVPLDDEIIYGIASEALSRRDSANLILMDGTPRYRTQVDDVIELALLDERMIRGMLMTTVAKDTAIVRMIKRGSRIANRPPLSVMEADQRIEDYQVAFDPTILKIKHYGWPLEEVETSGSKVESTAKGLQIVRHFLDNPTDPSVRAY
jgi:adenylate kinase family enzyme